MLTLKHYQIMSTLASPKILITGATGTIGQELTSYLSSQGHSFRAMVRSVGKAGQLAQLPGAELIEGDFNDILSLKKVLTGIDRAFLLTNSSELAENQQTHFVEAAQSMGVKQIVKLSQWAASIDSPVRFLRYHAVVENLIRESGISYTFLRPNLFMQGLFGFRETIIQQGWFYGAIGESKISMVDIRDIARVAACALTEEGHEGKTYDLTGPEALSHYEVAEQLTATLGYEIKFIDIPSPALRDMLLGVGFPEWQAEGLVEDYAHYKRGEAAAITSGVRDATGVAPISLDQFARDHAQIFAK
jgi:uncharacterized protein YbjT (DUF2867 family)